MARWILGRNGVPLGALSRALLDSGSHSADPAWHAEVEIAVCKVGEMCGWDVRVRRTLMSYGIKDALRLNVCVSRHSKGFGYPLGSLARDRLFVVSVLL